MQHGRSHAFFDQYLLKICCFPWVTKCDQEGTARWPRAGRCAFINVDIMQYMK
jgi:hypothetical protein